MSSIISTSACGQSPRRNQSGFSLIELAVVLVIIGLLVGGGLAAFEAGTEQMRRSEQKRQFETVRMALYGFAMSEGRLPCPDTTYPPDGREDLTAETPFQCSDSKGALPWVDLGAARRDSWGFPLRYRVTTDPSTGHDYEAGDPPDFADGVPDPPATFRIGDDGDLTIYSNVDAGGTLDDEDLLAEKAVVVVVSYGPQGGQVWRSDAAGGFDCPAGSGGFSAEEHENCNADDNFVDAGYRPPDVDNGFDDMVMWIPYSVLSTRMVEAGKLP